MALRVILCNRFLVSIGSVASAGPGWKYGGEEWGGLCAEGLAQSPVDLGGPAEFDGGVGELTFVNYESQVHTVLTAYNANILLQ